MKFEEDFATLQAKLENDKYAVNAYRALCNVQWIHVSAPQNWQSAVEKASNDYYISKRVWRKEIATYLTSGFRRHFLIPFMYGKKWYNKIASAINARLSYFEISYSLSRVFPGFSWLYSCTWRHAGGLIADIRNKGEHYLDFYCSGGEGSLDPDFVLDMSKLGWTPIL